MITKQTVLTLILGAGIGSGATLLSLHNRTAKEAKQEQKTEVEVQSQATVTQNAATALKTTSEKKTYSDNGKLKEKVVTVTKYVTQDKIEYRDKVKTEVQEKVKTETKTTVVYPRFMLGVSLEPRAYLWPKIEDLNVMAGYRIVGGLFVTGQTDVRFKQIKIGVVYEF